MKRLELFYPLRPYGVNQAWGIKNPIYEQFGFSRHNGIDLRASDGQALHSPISGTVLFSGSNQSSGNYISIISDEEYMFDDGIPAYVGIDFLHNKQNIFFKGLKVKVGSVITLADNTGFSTGVHSHMQPRRFWKRKADTYPDHKWYLDGYEYVLVDKNDANGSFDPEPYWNGKYADQVYNSWLKSILDSVKGLLKRK